MIQLDGRTVIFDSFIRDDILYLISTYYNKNENPITITCDGLSMKEYGYKEYEPCRYFYLNVESKLEYTLIINNHIFKICPRIIKSVTPSGIGIATLFKHDYSRILSFVEYYTSQGVTEFWFYYNGPTLPSELPTASNIHYELWNFNYRNKDTDFSHCAQVTFLTLARLIILPNVNWLFMIDLDEYIQHQELTLKDYIESLQTDKSVIQVRNHWARRKGDEVEYSVIPNNFNDRSKCIYKHTYTDLFSIHMPKNKDSLLKIEDLKMLHINDNLPGGSHNNNMLLPQPTAKIHVS